MDIDWKNHMSFQKIQTKHPLILTKTLETWFSRLKNPQDGEVLSLYYGLEDQPMNMEAIAQQKGVTRSRIHQIISGSKKVLMTSPLPPNVSQLYKFLDYVIRQNEGVLTTQVWVEAIEVTDKIEWGVKRLNLLFLLCDLHASLAHSRDRRLLFQDEQTSARFYEVQKYIEKVLKKEKIGLTQEVLCLAVKKRLSNHVSDEFILVCLECHEDISRRENARYVLSKVLERERAEQERLRYPGEPGTQSYELELQLRQQWEQVDLIGKLPIIEAEFQEMCSVIKKEALAENYQTKEIEGQPLKVPPALFLTTMVFTARYSQTEARKFWEPYQYLVWGREHSQAFQTRCRKRFKQAVAFAQLEFDFYFPMQSEGDLVSPIYRHAIIPAYLQSYFAQWLRSKWKQILQLEEEELLFALQQEENLQELPYVLRYFIQSPETADTATELIQNMATAVSLYREGATLEDIQGLLTNSPIEQSIWQELAQDFLGQSEAKEFRRGTHRLEWIWAQEDIEMQLRLWNLIVMDDEMPDRLVWMSKNSPIKDVIYGDIYIELDPWETEEGTWLIDEVIFEGEEGPLNGELIVLGETDSELARLLVPPLPQNPIQFFRLTQQDVYAIPIAENYVQMGRYIVAQQKGVTLWDEENQQIFPEDKMFLPDLLAGYEQAGVYKISLPLTIKQDETILHTLQSTQRIQIGKPTIEGSDPIPNLSSKVPPTFTSSDIWLHIPYATERLVNRTSLWLKSAKRTRQIPLRDLNVAPDQDGLLRVPIGTIIADFGAGNYTVELRQNLRSILSTTLAFSYLPGVTIHPPCITDFYTPLHLPTGRIKGVQLTELANRERLTVMRLEEETFDITWRDLRQGCRLQIQSNGNLIPLVWDVSRFFVWLEPRLQKMELLLEDLLNTTLKAMTTRKDIEFFWLQIAGTNEKRFINFNKRKRFSGVLGNDSLYDALKLQEGNRLEINVHLFKESWPLFTMRRRPQLTQVEVEYDETERSIILNTHLDQVWQEPVCFRVRSLSYPLAPPQVSMPAPKLQDIHFIPADLLPDNYCLDILDDNSTRPLCQDLVFTVGQPKVRHRYNSQLLDLIAQDTEESVPEELGESFVMILAEEAQRRGTAKDILTPYRLWQLFTLPVDAYDDLTDALLLALSPILPRLKAIHEVEQWEEKIGLLPAWAVTSRPMSGYFHNFDNPPRLLIYPEIASCKGQKGIGHLNLQFGGEGSEKQRVYVRWQPVSGDLVQLIMGIDPEATPDKRYAHLDPDQYEWDMYSVYQCAGCGWFTDDIRSDIVQRRHRHGQAKAQFIDALIPQDESEYVLSQLVLSSYKEHLDLDSQDLPETVIDQEAVLDFIQQDEVIDLSPSVPPLSPDAYRYAWAACLQRYRTDMEATRQLDRLVRHPQWRPAFKELTTSVLAQIEDETMPAAFIASARLLDALSLHAKQQPLLTLDIHLFLLVLLIRSEQYDPHRTKKLCKQISLARKDLSRMLHISHTYCPELLQWAFTWVELFHIHTIS
jgi:hypothetical protein